MRASWYERLSVPEKVGYLDYVCKKLEEGIADAERYGVYGRQKVDAKWIKRERDWLNECKAMAAALRESMK